MCEEVKRMLFRLDMNDLMTKLALQCSPVIAGVKMSNLIVVKKAMIPQVKKIFAGTGLEIFVFCGFNENSYALIYREEELIDWLNQDDVRKLLEDFGYFDLDIKNILSTVSKRYRQYCRKEIDFPHELGLLLGFPTEDVVGFIENDGRDFLLCGYWKVYSDIERANRLFKTFDRAKEDAIRLIFGKRDILELLDSASDIKKQNLNKLQIVQ